MLIVLLCCLLPLSPGALEAMAALGWVADEANPQELVVREGTFFSMKEVRGLMF